MSGKNNYSHRVGADLGICNVASVCLLLLALVVLLLEPQAGFSQSAPMQAKVKTGMGDVLCEIKRKSISRNVIDCITKIVDKVADDHIKKVVSLMQGYVTILAILAVALYGIRVMFGSARIRGESALLLIKFSLVVYFSTHSGLVDFRKTAMETTIGLGNAFMALLYMFTEQEHVGKILADKGLGISGLTDAENVQTFIMLGEPRVLINPLSFPFLIKKLSGTAGGEHFAIFDVLDKTILSILGIGEGNKGFIAMAWLFIGTFFGGPIGVAVGMFILSIVIALLMACIQITFVFALAIIGLTFLFAMGPIFIPLALFSATKPIFQNWLAWILSLMLQPMVLIIFLVIMLFAIDWTFVQPLKKVYQEAQATLTAPDSKNQMLILGGSGYKGSGSGTNSLINLQTPVWGSYAIKTEMTSNGGIGFFPGAETHKMVGNNLPTQGYRLDLENNPPKMLEKIGGVMEDDVYVPYLDWDAKKLQQVIGLLVPGFMLTILMISFQKELPKWVSDLVGNRQVASLAGLAAPLEAAGTNVRSWVRGKASWHKGSGKK